jgi:hypothetical protein
MGRPVTLVFLVDALGWEIVERFGFGRNRFARRAALGTVLGYSSAAIPSLLSGARPDEHGAWSMFRLAGERGTFARWGWIPPLPHALDWRARRFIRRWVDRSGCVSSYYDLYEIPAHLLNRFDLAQAGDPFAPGGLARETVFDWMQSAGVRYRLWSYRTPEEENLERAIAALADPPDVIFVYTAELDALMHRAGIFHDAVEKKLARYERFLAAMETRARDAGVDLSVVLLSDHGMTDVTAVADPWGAMERLGFRLGRDYLAFFDSTMARAWGDERALAAMAEAMGGQGRRLGDDELRALGCHFPGGEYGRAVFLADPGVLIVPSFMGSRVIAAMHGYHPDDAFSRGCFMSTAPLPAPDSILGFKGYLQALRAGEK